MVADWIEPPARPGSKPDRLEAVVRDQTALIERLQAERDQLRIALDLVSGALVDASVVAVPADVMEYGNAVRQLARRMMEAERL